MLQTFNVPAGGRIVNAKASFFRFESASAGGSDESIRVRADGQDLGTYLPGDSITLPVDAKSWELTPVTPTATAIVRLGVGGVESSRVFGSMRVLDEVTDAIQHAVNVAPTALTTFSQAVLVAPGANTKGLLIRFASTGGPAGAGGQTNTRIVAAKSAPTGFFAPSQSYQVVENFNATANDVGSTVRVNKLLPAGWGLYQVWTVTVAAPASGPSAVVGYELVP